MTDLYSKCSFEKLKKVEADILRKAIEQEYIKMGGEPSKLGKATLHIYEDLEEKFKEKFAALKIKLFWKDNHGNDVSGTGPGHSFLKNFFYPINQASEKQHHLYHIDFCYLFAYGVLRESYISSIKNADRPSSPKIGLTNRTFIVSSTDSYSNEINQIKERVEKFGYFAEKDIREIKYMGIDSLVDFFNAPEKDKNVILLIGEYSLKNETFVNELNTIRKDSSQNFFNNVILLFLPDVCNGGCNISSTSGLHKINEFWYGQIQYFDSEEFNQKLNSLPKQVKKNALQNAKKAKDNLTPIISDMNSIVTFLKDARSLPYAHFINHFSFDEFDELVSRTFLIKS